MNLLQDPRLWLELLVLVWNVALTLAVWLRKPGEDAARAVIDLRTQLATELATLASRLTVVETDMEHMPTKEELARLEGTVKQIDERTEGLAEGLSTVRTQLNRIENYLLSSKP